MFETPHSRWRALEKRNPLAASAFIYGVKTTHIYCRPTCPSRLARKANVIFFDSAIEAECAGFRACKRCKPSQSDFEHQAGHRKAVRKACELMDAAGGVLTLESLAGSVRLSPRYFHGVFKAIMGLTPSAYATKVRKEKSYGNALPNRERDKACIQDEGPRGSNAKEYKRTTLPSLDFSFTAGDLPFDEALFNEALPNESHTGFGPTSLGSSCCQDARGCFQCIPLLTGNHVIDNLTLDSVGDCGVPPVWELPNFRYQGILAHVPGNIPPAHNFAGPQNEGDFTGLFLTPGDLPSDCGSQFGVSFLHCD